MSSSDYKIKYVAPLERNALALESQTFIPIELKSKKGLTESDENIFVINALDETNVERNKVSKYRIGGKLQIITDNSLIDAWSPTPIPDTAWTPITEEAGLDKSFIPRNWLLAVSYPFESDEDKEVVTNGIATSNFQVSIDSEFVTKAHEGFQIKALLPANYKNGITNILIQTSQKHGITSLDDYVYISPKNNFINNGVDTKRYLGLHRILDFEAGNEEYGLILDTEYIVPTQINQFSGQPVIQPFLGVGKRVFDPSYDDTVFAGSSEVLQVQICNFTGGTNGDTTYTKIYSNDHALRVNDFVEIRTNGEIVPGGGVYGDSILTMPNLYKVLATPTLDTFVIKYDFSSLNPTLSPINPTNFVLRYKYMDGVPSEYYYRKNKILTEPKDYEAYQAAYSTNIFTDDYIDNVFLFHYNIDVDVKDLTDNLGRPLSELYLTVTKRAGSGAPDYDGFRNFSSNFQILDSNRGVPGISNGTNPAVIEVISQYNNSGNGNTAGSYKNLGDSIYNDFVEYNRAFLDERVLADTVGKFGPSQVLNNPYGNTDPNDAIFSTEQGYYYKINNKIQIREFSETIETVEDNGNELFPIYAQVNNDSTVSWRDLLDIGFFQPTETGRVGVDYPFVNFRHYLFGEYPIYIRRQLGNAIIQRELDENRFVRFKLNSTPNDEC